MNKWIGERISYGMAGLLLYGLGRLAYCAIALPRSVWTIFDAGAFLVLLTLIIQRIEQGNL